jgi:hypothetical protein
MDQKPVIEYDVGPANSVSCALREGNMTTTRSDTNTLLSVLQERQRRIIASLPAFAKATIPAACILFLVSFIVRVSTDTSLRIDVSRGFSDLSLGSVISLLLGVFSNLVVWIFVIWSLSFVPYIAIQAHKASRHAYASLQAKPMRWVQLYAATFLPMAIFATAWNSFASQPRTAFSIRIGNWTDFLALLLGSSLVVMLLAAVNYWIPVRFAAVRLSFLSLLLYIALFLTYGQGITMASHAMVFGILIYIMFWSGQIADLSRRISLHDIDPRLAERFDEIFSRDQELRGLRDETELRKREHEAEMEKQQLQLSTTQSASDLSLNQQLAQIRQRKVVLNKDMNEVQLQVLETKIETLGEIFGILSEEMHNRMTGDIPEKLKELRQNVKGYSPEEIQSRMANIIGQINSNLQGIPETLEDLRTQLIATTTELERQTKLLADESRQNETGQPDASSGQPASPSAR